MQNIIFTAPFKPSGTSYTKLCLWNRYIHNKSRLILTLIPAIFGIYLFATSRITYLMPLYIILMLYPVLHVLTFVFKIKKHLRFRSKADTAIAKFTIMDNGILIEREELDMYNMFHWDDFSRVVDFSEFILLYDKIKLSLVLPKSAMTNVSPSEVRDYIAKRIYKK